MRRYDALILCGGLGTRLRPVISDIPKPMAPVNGKPFLHYQLDLLISSGLISRLVLCAGYKHEIIEEHFGHEFKGVPVCYSLESEPLGTGGAVANALPLLSTETFFLLNGDTYFAIDLSEVVRTHTACGSDITIALKHLSDFDRYGCVEVKDSRITAFQEKKKVDNGYINGGIYLVERNIFSSRSFPRAFSFEKDLLQQYVGALNMCGVVSEGYFIDIGVPGDYAAAQASLH